MKYPATLQIQTSPHIRRGLSTRSIMGNVVLALLPTVGWSVWVFGLAALAVITVATLSAVLAESLYCRFNGREDTIGDWSAVISGLLLGLTLPPGLPLWMVALGGVVAILLGKSLFGGLGCNVFNPALVGRVFLQTSFPVALTTWTPAFAPDRFTTLPASSLTGLLQSPVDGVSAATPLGLMKFDQVTTPLMDLVMGSTAGSVGETGALFILAGGCYLILRGMMDWRIPAAVFTGTVLISGVLHLVDPALYPGPGFMLFSGGLMLGAVFMATDMVGSPVTPWGVWIFGLFIGALVVVIRIWGGLTEGVMYTILLANSLAPLIERWTQPRIYGQTREATHD